MLTTLILAAGNGERFAGYPQSKPLLPMPDGHPLIAWVCARLSAGPCVVVAREQDTEALRPHVGIAAIVPLVQVTAGPLASAYAAREWLHGELLIVYCDVLLDCRAFVRAARMSGAPHACVTFTSHDSRYGYWDGSGVVERQVVSDRAVSGVFYFRDAAAFLAACSNAPHDAGIPALLSAETFCHHDDHVVDVGAPADYEAFLGTEAATWQSR